MSIKKVIGKIHLWLGFTSGLVVFIVSITGCIYAFQAEIQELTQSYRHVEKKEVTFITPSELQAIAEKELPGKKIHSVQYEGRERAALVSFYSFDPLYYHVVYVNPYTGEVLKVKNMYQDFFYLVLMGHFYLWLPPAIGQPLVASATLIFIIMLITGLILWWPKKNKSKQRFTVKWSARWRRKNYDLHNVLGFYMTSVAVILAVTGLVWGFQWFAKSYYWIISGGRELVVYEEPHSILPATSSRISLPVDKVWVKMNEIYPSAHAIEVHFPETDTSSIVSSANPDGSTYWKTDYRYFDQYTLKELPVDQIYGRFDRTTTADKVFRMNYDIHTGAIIGLPGKILAFCVSLIAASLPVTGFLIWWGRRTKKPETPERLAKNPQKLKKSVKSRIPAEV
jgi:uncharacterized iron-regulated membrane protein